MNIVIWLLRVYMDFKMAIYDVTAFVVLQIKTPNKYIIISPPFKMNSGIVSDTF